MCCGGKCVVKIGLFKPATPLSRHSTTYTIMTYLGRRCTAGGESREVICTGFHQTPWKHMHALTPTHPAAATKTPQLQSLSHQTIQLANLTDIKRSYTVPTEQSTLEKDCCEDDSEAVFHDSVTLQASPSHFEISPEATPSFSLSPSLVHLPR